MGFVARVRQPIGTWALVAGVLAAAALAGLLAAAKVDAVGPFAKAPLSQIASLPLPVYPVAALALAVPVLARSRWWLGLGLFFLWLPFEDLVRKFSGNDLRVFLVKDLLLVLAVVSVAPRLRGCWRKPLGRAWLPTMAVFVVAALYSLAPALTNPSLPAVGLLLRFFFALLFPVGAYLAMDSDRLRRAIFSLAVLGAVVCSLGVAQSLIGPEFLNPSEAGADLTHLVVVKTIGTNEVVRPSGPFADVGRFASMTIVALTLAICSFRLAATRFQRRVGAVAIALALAGSFASGSRTSVLVCAALVAGSLYGSRGRVAVPSVALLGGLLGAVALLGLAFAPIAVESSQRADFYAETLNPTSGNFEVFSRLRSYAANAGAGIRSGGLLGNGTGTQSLGRQYLVSPAGAVGGDEQLQADSESGWGSVAQEWGILGLIVWCAWVVSWLAGLVRASRIDLATSSRTVTPIIALYLASLLTVMFSLGAGFFDNYIANCFFWLLSGVVFRSQARPTAPLPVPDGQSPA